MKSKLAFPGLALATAVLTGAAVAAVVTEGTFGMFSSTAAATASTAGAATVAIGRGDGTGPELVYELDPGADTLPVTIEIEYEGSVMADLALSLTPGDGGTPLCRIDGGTPRPRTKAPLTIQVEGDAPRAYCSVLDGQPIPLAAAVAPGSTVEVDLFVRLGEGANPGVSAVEQFDRAVVTATGAGGGFTDRVEGTVELRVADFDEVDEVDEQGSPTTAARGSATAGTDPGPAYTTFDVTDDDVPTECANGGMTAATFDGTAVQLADHATTWVAAEHFGDGAGPLLVLGTAGDDTITGSPEGDCLAGGDGDDELRGGDGDDVLIGGAGDDILRGEDGDDTAHGGAGDDELYGGPGRDDLVGGEGSDSFVGGPDGATCDRRDGEPAEDCAEPVGGDVESAPGDGEPETGTPEETDEDQPDPSTTDPGTGTPETDADPGTGGSGAGKSDAPAAGEPTGDAQVSTTPAAQGSVPLRAPAPAGTTTPEPTATATP